MKIVVCDDDLNYATDIKNNVEHFFQSHYISSSCDLISDSSKLWSKNEKYDLAFLDIQMTPYNGIEVAEKLKRENPNIVIFFITSYDQYLDDAMDLNAFRYIKKPLDVKRLQAGIKKAISRIDNTTISFHLKNGKETKTVLSSEIVYVEIVGRFTKVVTISTEYLSDKAIGFWKK